MNAHSVANLYFIKNDPANVCRTSILFIIQQIALFNLFAALHCDKSEDFLLFAYVLPIAV